MVELYGKAVRAAHNAGEARQRVLCRAERGYQPLNLALLFFVFCAVGYVWEVAVDVVRVGALVNRGVLYGPWLPIYGVVGLAMVVFCRAWVQRPGRTFVLMAVVCGGIEYAASWMLEAATGMRWWDYSFMPLSIGGRVCVEVLVFFAAAGMAAVYLLAPALDDALNRLKTRTKGVVLGALGTALVCDLLVAVLCSPNTQAV